MTRIGNKTNLLPIILSVFPREFGRYIEIFGGSGAVLLGKEPSKFEVYNDIEGELVNFFRIVKNRPAELLLELDLLPLNSREEFTSWLHFHDGSNEPNIHLADQLEIIDRTTPASLTEEAENSLPAEAAITTFSVFEKGRFSLFEGSSISSSSGGFSGGLSSGNSSSVITFSSGTDASGGSKVVFRTGIGLTQPFSRNAS